MSMEFGLWMFCELPEWRKNFDFIDFRCLTYYMCFYWSNTTDFKGTLQQKFVRTQILR